MDFTVFENKASKKKPAMSKFKIIALAVIIILLISGALSLSLITDFIWMDNLGFKTIFTTILGSKLLLSGIGFVLFLVLSAFTFFWVRSAYISHLNREQLPSIILEKKKSNAIIYGISIVIGLLGSSLVQGIGWEPLLKFLNQASFGITDPHFNMDISFYMYTLPVLKIVLNLLLGLAIFFFFIEAGFYSVFSMYRKSKKAQVHMGITVGFIGLLLAGLHLLAPYETLLTNQVNIFQESAVYGLSYTDQLINIPKSYVLAAVAVIGAIWIIIAMNRGKLISMVMPIAAYLVLVVIGQLASIAVQSFVVSPNEFSREEQYLAHNLEFTRAAYQLAGIEEQEHPANDTLDNAMVERNMKTIENVRINDVRPLQDVYDQTQTIRPYYTFNDVDIDRYMIDGDYEQVFISARELRTEDLSEQAKTWENLNLRYTHGYGIVMSHVNQVTPQGQPEYMVTNLPPQGEVDITRPQIYFGEESYDEIIVNSKKEEFDYPQGGDNVTSRYEASEGIPMTGLNRLLFAIETGNFRMLVSDQITKDSYLLHTRNIMDRVNRIAPFFTYDSDPYIFIREDGSLAWMIDAYLTEEKYPYAEPYTDSGDNYIRNSVKVVVDAYSGDVNFYVVDSSDPLLQTYQNIFPELFEEEIPEDVQSHFRYPEMLFKVQASVFGTYHMSNLEVFYNREDVWEIPTEKYYNEDVEMEPYYVTMKLPDSDEEEFILMQPYSPRNRQNMIAWMGVRNDGENYGEIFVYRFPKHKSVYGPQQIENRINQDSVISQQLNLWSQGGSEVIRGNLLAIPIEDTILYVEPIYIESSNETSLPEVKQVVVAYEDYIVMEESFEKALDKMLEIVDPNGAPSDVEDPETDNEEEEETEEPLRNAEETLQQLSELFDDYQSSLTQGDWQKAAELMIEIETILEEIQ
ncbi:UPF0182 family membrane protein [Ornithinibacillus halotolerans]|uniref:UPF0182 protein GCM10008025_25390 n=1 Tax=Ornithinibacillus halotolerans TaxID=1274357 RepID=A0A916S304_9BACI|nr:UPF0182 family protein [Ornithinibacillus halotolerans]GGA80971.1 membrane protein [Ornithinibacillus halotolerans]